MYIKEVKGRGRSLFSLDSIKYKDDICLMNGIVTDGVERYKNTYYVDLTKNRRLRCLAYSNKMFTGVLINTARRVARKNNCKFVIDRAYWAGKRLNSYGVLKVRATCNIRPNSELFVTYLNGIKF